MSGLRSLVQSALHLLLDHGLPWLIQAWQMWRPSGVYEVLDHEVCLELKDARGQQAIYHKRQRVRFLQNFVRSYSDIAWGVGDIFAAYQCSPGKAVDRYREGHRWIVLISLHETKNRGDEETFHIKRTILNGFPLEQEDLQTEVDYRMRKLTVRVIFPCQRPPKSVMTIEQKSKRTGALAGEAIYQLADGRQEAVWRIKRPRRYEAYILSWEW